MVGDISVNSAYFDCQKPVALLDLNIFLLTDTDIIKKKKKVVNNKPPVPQPHFVPVSCISWV